ncbi:MAG: ATP-binding protein [Candidatus Binatia bacterium]|nr:ATP-binding protein [Candidatus Binatia bacterium]
MMENVLGSLGEAVVLTDRDGIVVFLNPAAQELMGWSEAQVCRRPVRDVFAASPVVADLVSRTLASAQRQACGETVLQIGAGRSLPLRVSCSPVWSPHGAIEGTALVFHDLTYQRKLEQAVRRTETLARLGALVAGLAHEVKNPLGGIRGTAQLLADRYGNDPEIREYTSIMIRETDRLARLVEQLLLLGSPATPKLEPVNVHRTLHEVLRLCRPQLERSGIGTALEIDPSLPEIWSDPDQLTQLFLNLVHNACEAMESGGRLTIVTRMETDYHIVKGSGPGKFVRVEIADTGPGFAEEVLDQAFEPFFTTKPKGTGLGLAICQRIVTTLGGYIHLGNRELGGAVVTVHLPVDGRT